MPSRRLIALILPILLFSFCTNKIVGYKKNRYKITAVKICLFKPRYAQSDSLVAAILMRDSLKPLDKAKRKTVLLSLSYNLEFVPDSSVPVYSSIFFHTIYNPALGLKGSIDSIESITIKLCSKQSEIILNKHLARFEDVATNVPNLTDSLPTQCRHSFRDLDDFTHQFNSRSERVESESLFCPSVFNIDLPRYAVADSPRLVYEISFSHGRILRDTFAVTSAYSDYYPVAAWHNQNIQ